MAFLKPNPIDLDTRAVLAAIVEHSDDAIIGVTPDGRVTSWNPAAERLFGYSATEVIGHDVRLLVPPGTREPAFFDALQNGGRSCDCNRRTKDGRVIDVAVNVSPVRDAAGEIIGACLIARDVTPRNQDRQAALDSEARYRQLADALPQIVWEADSKGRVIYYNRRWYEMTGLPNTTSLPSSANEWRTVIPEEDAELVARRWADSVQHGQPHQVEVRLLDVSAGRHRWQLIRAVPVRDDTGRILRWFGTMTDIDDLKRAEADRHRAEELAKEQQATLAHMERVRTMGQLASGLAHELNQPLGAIMNYSAVLKADLSQTARPPDVKADVSLLNDILKESARAGEIIRRLRGFVKKQRPYTQPRDINLLIGETLNLLAYDLRQAGVRPALVLEVGLPETAVDAIQIQQVLVNLIRNAIDAMSGVKADARQLRIVTATDAGGVRVSVTDNGCGIPPSHLERVFESFYTTKSHGLGMGLALCRTMIEEHNGTLVAWNEPGGGTTFSFRVPPIRPTERTNANRIEAANFQTPRAMQEPG